MDAPSPSPPLAGVLIDLASATHPASRVAVPVLLTQGERGLHLRALGPRLSLPQARLLAVVRGPRAPLTLRGLSRRLGHRSQNATWEIAERLRARGLLPPAPKGALRRFTASFRSSVWSHHPESLDTPSGQRESAP